MKLTRLSDQRIIVSRLMTYSGGGSKHALSTVTAVFAHLQQLSPDKTMAVAGVPGKTYVIFVDGGDDIKENDQIKDEAGLIYTVRKGGITRWRHGAMDYKEIHLTQS